MKKKTKIKVTAIAAGFTLTALISTFILVTFNHPAQWYAAGACGIGMIATFLFTCLIEN